MAASSNLHAAVEALTKAALEEGQVVSIETSKLALAELKRGAAASQATSDKLDTLINLAEIQTLQSAIQLLNSFDSANKSPLYSVHIFAYSKPKQQDMESTWLVGDILARSFMCDMGMRLGPNGYYYIGTADAKGEAAFRARLSENIQILTGTKPRFVQKKFDDVEEWVIYRK